MASAESLFRYIREHSTVEPPPLQRLHLCSNPLGNDYRLAGVTNDPHLIKANSTSFICEISHDDSRRTEVIVACTKLSEELNEKMQRIVREGETPSPAEMAKVDFRVALEGPISKSQLEVMRKTDPSPFPIWDH
jgi:vacuolar-type H+-ATPase subunit F/Vma7